MSRELQEKLRLHKEKREAEKILSALDGIKYHGPESIPEWVDGEIAEYLSSASVPDSQISDELGEDRVESWMEQFAEQAGIGQTVHIRTSMQFFPWLECALPERGWARKLREVLGSDLMLLSHDIRVLVVFFEGEYEYHAFAYVHDA